jgi:hypothetical protein
MSSQVEVPLILALVAVEINPKFGRPFMQGCHTTPLTGSLGMTVNPIRPNRSQLIQQSLSSEHYTLAISYWRMCAGCWN